MIWTERRYCALVIVCEAACTVFGFLHMERAHDAVVDYWARREVRRRHRMLHAHLPKGYWDKVDQANRYYAQEHGR